MAGALLGNDGFDRKRVLPIGARHGRNRPVELDANLGNDVVRNRNAELDVGLNADLDDELNVNVVRNRVAELVVEVLLELALPMVPLETFSLGTVTVFFWNLQLGVRMS